MSLSLDYHARFATFSRESNYVNSTPGVATAADITALQVSAYALFLGRKLDLATH